MYQFIRPNIILKMKIGDVIPPRQACIALLKYIYYDDVHNIQTQDALYLFSASHYFQFSNCRLSVFCRQILEANVSKNNVFDVINFFLTFLFFQFFSSNLNRNTNPDSRSGRQN
jgi:hypothetical protein